MTIRMTIRNPSSLHWGRLFRWGRNLRKITLIFTFVTAVFLAINNVVVAAELKAGFVDTARVLKQAPQAETARAKLKSEFAPRDNKIVALQKKLKKMEEQLGRDALTMSEVVRKKMERDMISLKRDIKRAKEEFNEDLNIRRNEELAKLQKFVYDIIVSVAKDGNYDIIVGDSVLYASKRVDITDMVLERLRLKHKRQSAQGAKIP